MLLLLWIPFLAPTYSLALRSEYLFNLHQSVAPRCQDLNGAETAPKSSFLCVSKSPIGYGFRAGARAFRYSENIALVSPFGCQS